MILLDTHVAIWMANDDKILGSQSRDLILQAKKDQQLAVSAISFWEIALLVAKERLELTGDPSELRKDLIDSGVAELPLTGDIGILAVGLENLHGDPADRFIAATAIAHDATLVTADERLLGWRHKLRRQNAER